MAASSADAIFTAGFFWGAAFNFVILPLLPNDVGGKKQMNSSDARPNISHAETMFRLSLLRSPRRPYWAESSGSRLLSGRSVSVVHLPKLQLRQRAMHADHVDCAIQRDVGASSSRFDIPVRLVNFR